MCIENHQVRWKDGRGTTDFPGERDMGTPLITTENGRQTVIGIFLKQMQGPAVFAQITPATVNWIYRAADWTQESSCSLQRPKSLFSSCQCGEANNARNNRYFTYFDCR